jgi:RNA polymerase sigma-70 factor (ECF subfamily)
MNPLAVSDEHTLSERLARGDRGALAVFYERYAGLVFGVALRVLNDRGAAEEVVQETFLEAWRRATRYEPARASPAAWLITIGRSRAIDRARSRATQERVLAIPEGDAAVQTPETLVDLSRKRELIAAAVTQLPQEQRSLLELAWNEGLSQSAIARRCSLPLGTVKTRTRAALLELTRIVRGAADSGTAG